MTDDGRLLAGAVPPAACGAAGIVPLDKTADDTAEQTLEQFYRAVLPRVYSFLRSQVHSREAAQDLVGRVVEKACRNSGSVPEDPAGRARWIFRIAHTTLIDHWRVEGRRAAATVSLDEVGEVPVAAADPEAALALKERQLGLLRLIGQLQDQDRVLLALKFAGQRTNREIARILDLSEAAVSKRLLRALLRLRDRLQDRGIS